MKTVFAMILVCFVVCAVAQEPARPTRNADVDISNLVDVKTLERRQAEIGRTYDKWIGNGIYTQLQATFLKDQEKFLKTDEVIQMRLKAFRENPADPEPLLIERYKGTRNQYADWQEWAVRNARTTSPKDSDQRGSVGIKTEPQPK